MTDEELLQLEQVRAVEEKEADTPSTPKKSLTVNSEGKALSLFDEALELLQKMMLRYRVVEMLSMLFTVASTATKFCINRRNKKPTKPPLTAL